MNHRKATKPVVAKRPVSAPRPATSAKEKQFMTAAAAAAAARPHGGTHGISSLATAEAKNLPMHTPLHSVLSQFRESEATWAHEKVK
jgi:hypothetical protein